MPAARHGCNERKRRRGGIEPLHVSMPHELKSCPSTSLTHLGKKWRFQKKKNAAATVSGRLQQLGMEKQIGGKIFCFLNLLLPGRGLGGLKKKYYCFGFLFFESLTNSASWEELPSRSISPAIPQLHVNRRLWEWATSSELL